MTSWFPDIWQTTPSLWIIGGLGSSKTTLLKIMKCMCRRGILVSDISEASFYKLVDQWQPTLLLDESEYDNSLANARFRRLLRGGSNRGAPIVRNGRLYRIYGPKIIAGREVPSDAALRSRILYIWMRPTQKEMEPLDEAAIQCITEEFQGKLLQFRLDYYSRVAAARLEFRTVRHLTPRTRDMIQILSAPVIDAHEIVDRIIKDFTELDQDARVDQMFEPEWLVLHALFVIVHQNCGRDALTAGDLAKAVNEDLESQGERFSLSPRAVGSALKSLGFQTERLGSSGRGLRLTTKTWNRIHEMAARYGMTRRDTIPLVELVEGEECEECPTCNEHNLANGLRSVKPRPPVLPNSWFKCFKETGSANVHPK